MWSPNILGYALVAERIIFHNRPRDPTFSWLFTINRWSRSVNVVISSSPTSSEGEDDSYRGIDTLKQKVTSRYDALLIIDCNDRECVRVALL